MLRPFGIYTRFFTSPLNDGKNIKVSWTKLEKPREWFFYTNRRTIWKVTPDSWHSEELINFTFNNKPQNYDRFRSAPFWISRFGDGANNSSLFKWTSFYEEVASKLLDYRNDRKN